jgi:hypothetical protein
MRHVLDVVRKAKIPLTTRPMLNALLVGSNKLKVAAVTRLQNEGRLAKLADGYRVIDLPPAQAPTHSKEEANAQPSLF